MRQNALTALIWLTLLVSLAPQAASQRGKSKGAKPEALAYFDGMLDQALLEAKERNTSLLVVCCKEGEEANDRFREQLRDNGSFAADVGNVIVLLVNDGTHKRKQITRRGPDGKKQRVEVCEAYHTPSCDHHKRNWDGVYQAFVTDQGDGSWPLPCALIIAPDSKLHTMIGTGEPPGESEMLKALKQVRVKHGDSISPVELKRVKSLFKDGQAMASARAWPDAWHAWQGILNITDKGLFAEGAREGRTQAMEGMRARLAELSAAKGNPNALYPRLAEFASHARGTPIQKEAGLALKRLESHPDIDKELVKRVKLELEAEDMLREARGLLAGGDERGARKILKKLGGKKFAGTPAAAEGAGLLDD